MQYQPCVIDLFSNLLGNLGDGQTVVGFDNFIYDSVVPACFMAPLKSTFDLRDGQTVGVSFVYLSC